ncbi:MAG: hypothetical protein WDW38_001054 [Sanguina aurantia]
MVATFPTSVRHWTRYAEIEMSGNSSDNVKAIFGRCLLTCPFLELWRLYLGFIKRSNEGKGPEGLSELLKAYEFTLDCVGHDLSAGSLWLEFISFLGEPDIGTPAFSALFPSAVAGQEESQRVTVLRRAYQRAIVIPSLSVDMLWKNYERWELQLGANKMFARKLLDEWRPRYMAAKSALPLRRNRLNGINITLLPLPPGVGGLLQEQQSLLWRDYVAWEASNVQRLEGAALSERVSLAYDQCLLPQVHFPEVWLDYAQWHAQTYNNTAAAVQVMVRSQKALPDCLLLRFSHADMEEAAGHMEQASLVYEGLVSAIESEQAGTDSTERPLDLSVDQAGLVWIQYMRFLRRTDGNTAARKVGSPTAHTRSGDPRVVQYHPLMGGRQRNDHQERCVHRS